MEIQTMNSSHPEQDVLHRKEHKFVLSNLDRCTGSSMYTFGDNIVQCSLFGPQSIADEEMNFKQILSVFLCPHGQINNTFKEKSIHYSEYYFKKLFAAAICVERFSGCRTFIIVNEIEKGNSFLSCAINATTLAFLDSGYPLNHVIGSVSFVLDSQHNLRTTKQYKEDQHRNIRIYEPQCVTFNTPNHDLKATFTVVGKNVNDEQIGILAEGRFSLDDIFAVKQRARQPIEDFFEEMRDCVRSRLT